MEFSIRLIRQEDNAAVAKVIRTVFEEFGINKPGTAYFDDALNHMYESFALPRSVYYVVISNEELVGGGGIYPTAGLPDDTCELVKMYLLPAARGKGLGRALIDKCIAFARESGYKKIYLETMPELQNAVKMYEQYGFKPLREFMGNSGHYACDIKMLLEV